MNKPLVLVVEDDTPVRNLITTTLKTHEYRYLSAQNGASAVLEALSHNPIWDSRIWTVWRSSEKSVRGRICRSL